jgi:hypothetical protein
MEAVRLERDERGSPLAVATDGHQLLIVGWAEPSPADFPEIGNVGQVDGFSALIPPAAWKEAGKALPKRPSKEILSYVLVDESATNPLSLTTTDLQNVRHFSPPAAEGRFPRWQEVISPLTLLPKLKGRPRYAVRVQITPKLMADLLTTMAKMLGDNSDGVTLYVPVNGDTPLQIQAKGDSFQALGVIMPLTPTK